MGVGELGGRGKWHFLGLGEGVTRASRLSEAHVLESEPLGFRRCTVPREVGPWTKEKLRLLAQYLPIYLQATQKAIDRIYVDGFAGPGRNLIEGTGGVIDGSPLIALNTASDSGYQFTHLYFIESDHETADELRSTLRDVEDSERYDVIEGDVNEQLPRVMERVHRRAPTFVFLDPQGIDPQWATIEAIAKWKTELLINFPFGMAINRNLDSAKSEAYFGTSEWRAVRDAMRPDEIKPMLDFYKERLRGLGYIHQPDWDPLIRSTGGQKLYNLIHASKEPAGKRIMEWVQRQPGAEGQGKLKLEFD